ncbi:hypothetical protein [Streptococcus sanguinis]|uniref:Uncharacterized protein n=1 Tax=Streptococcus sanguinis SK355 TaxID=888816 RepID=F3USU0_STRSA|nr:hypothetical protein [Streptococcus sanguinis]EGJ37519.1 hypothetical protein HMPREF9389_1898 [Streptococcus sanguinis SK355]
MPKTLFLWLLTVLSLGLVKTPQAKTMEQSLKSNTAAIEIVQKIQEHVKQDEATMVAVETVTFD